MTERRLVFDGVWKRFRRGQVHDSLRDLIPAVTRKLLRRGAGAAELGEREFWALRDVSFEVRPGEVLGVIGGNGAGKSTTLKILNDLMEPTKGRVLAEGKIGSLIEVAAGFHQDLTGRQNVFLQGAIVGMREAEVRRKFDQIVEFAGVGEFIDTPVKRYSSGMNARLGFAIAAHLEPEILIIDEVLAVGDHTFQQRAFGKIKALAQSGIPVVLVSHQLDRILELSTKAILLSKGEVAASGTPAHCIEAYLNPGVGAVPGHTSEEVGVRFDELRAVDASSVRSGEHLRLRAAGACLRDSYPSEWQFGLRVFDTSTGSEVHGVLAGHRGIEMPAARAFGFEFDLQMNVPAGSYYVELFLADAARGQDVFPGPRVSVEVFDGLRHHGPAQLNSRWRELSTGGAPGAAAPPHERAQPA